MSAADIAMPAMALVDRGSLIEAMQGCMQNQHQNVLQHGQSVLTHYQMLMAHLRGGADLPSWWRLPKWAASIASFSFDDAIMAEYAEFHDCGKPFCRVVDEDGRQHFPGHAETSERIWLNAGGHPLAARLMGMDMDAHLLGPETIFEFASRPEAPALLLMAIAETHSNAMMFGGVDSDNFKIKMKRLDKRGGQAVGLHLAACKAVNKTNEKTDYHIQK